MAAKRTAALEAHGGRVHAESQGPGLGARFVIVLPATTGSLIGARDRNRRTRSLGTSSESAGTKRVRQLGHERASVSTEGAVELPDLQEERACACPRVDACPSIVLPS